MENSQRTGLPRTARALNPVPHQLKVEVREFKRRRLLECARERFFDQGYDVTTFRDLSIDLNVSKPFIYSYYPNKREVLAAVCEVGLTEALGSLDRALSLDLPTEKKLLVVVRSVTATIIEYRKCFVVYERHVLHLAEPAQRRLHGLRALFDQRMAELVARACSEGALCAGPMQLTVATSGALLLWIASWYSPETSNTTEAGEFMVGLFTRATGSIMVKP